MRWTWLKNSLLHIKCTTHFVFLDIQALTFFTSSLCFTASFFCSGLHELWWSDRHQSQNYTEWCMHAYSSTSLCSCKTSMRFSDSVPLSHIAVSSDCKGGNGRRKAQWHEVRVHKSYNPCNHYSKLCQWYGNIVLLWRIKPCYIHWEAVRGLGVKLYRSTHCSPVEPAFVPHWILLLMKQELHERKECITDWNLREVYVAGRILKLTCQFRL